LFRHAPPTNIPLPEFENRERYPDISSIQIKRVDGGGIPISEYNVIGRRVREDTNRASPVRIRDELSQYLAEVSVARFEEMDPVDFWIKSAGPELLVHANNHRDCVSIQGGHSFLYNCFSVMMLGTVLPIFVENVPAGEDMSQMRVKKR
jgi:hypothetical protein